MQLRPVMRTPTKRCVLATVGLCLAVTVVAAAAPLLHVTHRDPSGFAVVELFTSEGCSSCPPADALLGQLAVDARDQRLPVHLLAFHVDYWDQLGWEDPFSAAAYSRRQKVYAASVGSARIYTPQMIVNGRDEFVGSDRDRATDSIEAALARSAVVAVDLKLLPPNTERGGQSAATRTVAYTVAGAQAKALLLVAVVQAGLVSSVSRGENAGRVLRHDNVVRAFISVPLERGTTGTVAVPQPPGAAPKSTSIIGFVQDPSSMRILGATEIPYR